MMKSPHFVLIACLILFPTALMAEPSSSNDIELEKLIRQKDYLRTRLYELVSENKALEEKMKSFSDKANSFDEVLEEHKNLIQTLQNAKDKLEGGIKLLQEENNNLLVNLQDKEGFIRNIESNFEAKLKEDQARWKIQIDQKDQELSEVNAKFSKQETVLKKTEEELDGINDKLDKLAEENKLLTEKNDFYVKKVIEIEGQTQKEKLTYEKEHNALLERNQELTASVEELTKQNKDLSVSLSSAEYKLNKTEMLVKNADDSDALKKQVADLEDRFLKIQKAHEDSLEEITRLNHENENLLAKNEGNEERVNSSDASSHEQRISTLIEEKESAEQRADGLEKDKNTLMQELAILTDQHKDLEKKHKEVNRKSFDEINKTLEAKNKLLTEEKKSVEKEMAELQKGKDALMQELASFSDRYKTLEEKFNQISKAAVRNEELIAKEVEKARQPLAEINKALEKRVADLTNMIEKTSSTLSELVDKNRETDLSNRSLTNDNKKLAEKVALLETDLKKSEETFQTQLTETKTPLDGKIMFLEEKLKKADESSKSVGELAKERETLKEEIKSLRDANMKMAMDLEAVNGLLQETDSFVERKVQEANLQKDKEIESLRNKLGIAAESASSTSDVSLKDKSISIPDSLGAE